SVAPGQADGGLEPGQVEAFEAAELAAGIAGGPGVTRVRGEHQARTEPEFDSAEDLRRGRPAGRHDEVPVDVEGLVIDPLAILLEAVVDQARTAADVGGYGRGDPREPPDRAPRRREVRLEPDGERDL